MHTKKILSIITASALVAGSLSSCSLLAGLQRPHVYEALTSYMEAVHDSDFEHASEEVEDEEDAFLVNEMNDTEAELIAAILAASEYDIGDIELDSETATAEVTVTLPDIESIVDEGYSYEEFLGAIGDIDDTIDETLDFDLNKIDEAWLIEPDSTQAYYDLLMGLIADLNFSALTEDNALALVDTFMTDLASGNISEAADMLSNQDSQLYSYAQMASAMDGFADVISGYFARVDYVSEVTEVTEECITVTAMGTGPDMQAIINAVLDDPDVMVPLYADYIESMINGNTLNYLTIASSLTGAVSEQTAVAATGPMEVVFQVTEGEDGRLYLDPVSGLGFDIEIPDMSSRTEYVIPAVGQLLSEGRITFDQLANLEELTGFSY